MLKNDIECQYDQLDNPLLQKVDENNVDDLWEALKQCYYTLLFIIILISAVVLVIYLLTIIIT
jgi:hypothetical protein